MASAAAYDHVCAEYKNNRRGNDNFVCADCLPFDLDNTHSDDPAEWQTLDTVKVTFPGVVFYAVESRNHMKEKNGKAARPKYHLYFPIHEMTDAGEYRRLKEWVISRFPYFDTSAKDATRFFFGVENPQVQFSYETAAIDEYMPWSGTAPPEDTEAAGSEQHVQEGKQPFSLPDIIPIGERNNTLHRYAFRLHMSGLNLDEVLALTAIANERCEEVLDHSELLTLVNSACRQEYDRRAFLDRVEAAMAFTEIAQQQGEAGGTASVVRLSDLQERPPEWLIEGYIPKGEITVMAGDGGVGKTFVWCAIAAAISSGNKPFLLNNVAPDDSGREPQKVMYFSSEDSN